MGNIGKSYHIKTYMAQKCFKTSKRNVYKEIMSQLIILWYLWRRWSEKVQTSLHIHEVLSESLLLAHTKKWKEIKNQRGRSRISGKGVRRYTGRGWGEGVALMIFSFFLNIPWKWNNSVSVRPNYFLFIGHLKTGGWEGGPSEPPEPTLDLPLNLIKTWMLTYPHLVSCAFTFNSLPTSVVYW